MGNWLDDFFGPSLLKIGSTIFPKRPTINLVAGAGTVVGVTDDSVNNQSTLTIAVGSGGLAPTEIPLSVGLFSVASGTFQRIGARKLDMSVFPATIGALNRTVKFYADIQKTAGATSAEVQLYDVTNGAQVADVSYSTNTVLTEVVSGALTVGTALGNIRNDLPTMYEVDLRMNGGVFGTDSVYCNNARLVITYS